MKCKFRTIKGLTIEHCMESIKSVLKKREMQHAILVGMELDELQRKKCYLHHCNK